MVNNFSVDFVFDLFKRKEQKLLYNQFLKMTSYLFKFSHFFFFLNFIPKKKLLKRNTKKNWSMFSLALKLPLSITPCHLKSQKQRPNWYSDEELFCTFDNDVLRLIFFRGDYIFLYFWQHFLFYLTLTNIFWN